MKKFLPFISLPILAIPAIGVVSCSSSNGPGDSIMSWFFDDAKLKKEYANKDSFNAEPNTLEKLLKVIRNGENSIDRYTILAFERNYFEKIEFTNDKKIWIKLKNNSPFYLPNDEKEMTYSFK